MVADTSNETTHRLEIYVAKWCGTSPIAEALAAEVASWDVDNLVVDVIDLSEPNARRPESVFAVPTYILDGDVISLGNPTVDQLRALMTWSGG